MSKLNAETLKEFILDALKDPSVHDCVRELFAPVIQEVVEEAVSAKKQEIIKLKEELEERKRQLSAKLDRLSAVRTGSAGVELPVVAAEAAGTSGRGTTPSGRPRRPRGPASRARRDGGGASAAGGVPLAVSEVPAAPPHLRQLIEAVRQQPAMAEQLQAWLRDNGHQLPTAAVDATSAATSADGELAAGVQSAMLLSEDVKETVALEQ